MCVFKSLDGFDLVELLIRLQCAETHLLYIDQFYVLYVLYVFNTLQPCQVSTPAANAGFGQLFL